MRIEKMAEVFAAAWKEHGGIVPMREPWAKIAAGIASKEIHEAAFNERLRAVILCEEIEAAMGLKPGTISNRVAKADPLGDAIPIEMLESLRAAETERLEEMRELIVKAVTLERAACEQVCIDEGAAAGTEWRADVCHGISDLIDRRESPAVIADRLLAKMSAVVVDREKETTEKKGS